MGGEAEGSHSGLKLCMDHTKIPIQVWLLAVTGESMSGEEKQHLPWLPFLTPNLNYSRGQRRHLDLFFLLQFLVQFTVMIVTEPMESGDST